MKGTVRKRGKTWSYSFYLGEFNGKKRYKEKGGFATKGEATKSLNIALVDYESGGYVASKSMTMTQFSLDWLEGYVKTNRKLSTYNRYNELIKKYIIPTIGGMDISAIGVMQIEKILTDNRNLVSSSTLQAVYTIINTILNRAIKLKLINDNPCKYIERPKREKFVAETLTIDEINKLVNCLDLKIEYDYKFYIGLRIILELGIRRGELGGLEWSNINGEENTVCIKNNLIYTNGYTNMQTPKTIESIRTLYVSDELLELLRKLKITQNKFKLQYGEFYEVNEWNDKSYDLIMRWNTGKFIHPMYYLNKLKKVCKSAGITKNIRFHDLRHTNATLLLQQGVNFKIIQERLGHKEISTTMNIYSHVDKEMQKCATEKLNKSLEWQ